MVEDLNLPSGIRYSFFFQIQMRLFSVQAIRYLISGLMEA